MNVRYSLGIVAFLIGVTAGAVAQSPVVEGPVASVEEWIYNTEVRFGETEEVLVTHTKTIYDTEGNVVEEFEYSTSGDIVSRTVHKYDTNSCRIESIRYTALGAVELRIQRVCDETGREIQIDTYNSSGQLTGRTIEEYDGNLVRFKSYNGSGVLDAAFDMETDSNGNLIRMVSYDVDTGKATSVVESTYNVAGKVVRTLFYNEGGEMFSEIKYSYSYDEDGMDEITTTTLYLAGAPFRTTTEGLVIEVDSRGNWTERRTYKQQEQYGQIEWVLTKVERRTILYRQGG